MLAKMEPTRSALRVAAVASALVAATALVPAQAAQAIGNNRDVSRSCGVNHVASGRYSNMTAWAQTTRVSGNCSGTLGAGLRASDGYTWPRVNGTRDSAYTERTDSAGFGSGMHWGCLDCNVTYS
ncbi:hypothetical protein SAMN05421837_11453 [Amycolatopsis pretoriensis]|uniref:Uncharacterized protein n=1 Tax=Amycolatopsis pretoriensis TaxID=218821 RepID=A0A1H5RGK4_9PSEU|nr:hypothetical protein [Amycolatopsis pretoriensis]SEF37493.1 hypothetical protein SAMN05421837_11453 [Amycolatopsis pretoriensis]